MTYYADTSWWLALLYRDDPHHAKAWRIFDVDPEADVLWTPWQRVEVFNGLHQMERQAYLAKGEARLVIHRLEENVRLGYWRHREFNWTNSTRLACRLAERLGPTLKILGMDLFHVAVASTVRAEVFLTFDRDQKALAQAAGLTVSHPAPPR